MLKTAAATITMTTATAATTSSTTTAVASTAAATSSTTPAVAASGAAGTSSCESYTPFDRTQFARMTLWLVSNIV